MPRRPTREERYISTIVELSTRCRWMPRPLYAWDKVLGRRLVAIQSYGCRKKSMPPVGNRLPAVQNVAFWDQPQLWCCGDWILSLFQFLRHTKSLTYCQANSCNKGNCNNMTECRYGLRHDWLHLRNLYLILDYKDTRVEMMFGYGYNAWPVGQLVCEIQTVRYTIS